MVVRKIYTRFPVWSDRIGQQLFRNIFVLKTALWCVVIQCAVKRYELIRVEVVKANSEEWLSQMLLSSTLRRYSSSSMLLFNKIILKQLSFNIL